MPRNHLDGEDSPYLLQHVDNPVDWYPWGDEALERARREKKPIFLSIGYSSCHWCHVMAHESFENDEIAKIMNEYYISIKVDREERPDIDDVYQKACQLATGQGGWPLSAFLTPEQEPFYIGTYFPVLESYGRPGFGSILRQMAQAWREDSRGVAAAASKFLSKMNIQGDAEPARITRQILDEAAVNLLQMGDQTYGGFGRAPKFPNSSAISFMFRYYKLSGISKFRDFALLTLQRMAKGGIFDQIGGGFHRYSTDAGWLVPHFEKMLYDNAQIPVNYAEAYQITGDRFYLDIMEKTLGYILREMASGEGGFYSALDADSEGDEGRYYVWTKKEICDMLGDDAELFCIYYDVADGGNWEGSTILCNNVRLSTAAFRCGISEDAARDTISRCSGRLLEAREKRTRPGLDDKILASWNALAVSALVRGYRVGGKEEFLSAAADCTAFITSKMMSGGRLFRTYKGGRSRIPGYLEDYAFLANALLDMFEVTADAEYLKTAVHLGHRMQESFWDDGASGFFMTGSDHQGLIVRPQSVHDLSIPSGSSAACLAMLRLYHLTSEKKFFDTAETVMGGAAQQAAENPFAYGHLLNTIYLYHAKPVEITVLNTKDAEIARYLEGAFLPESITVVVPEKRRLAALQGYPFFEGKEYDDSSTRAFVCRDFSCSPAIHGVAELKRHLES